jgi:hypothetical protein
VVAALGPPTRPLPSDDLPTWTWSPTRKLIRVYHAHPAYSGRQHRLFGPLNRFDHQIRDGHQQPKVQPDGRGVIYLAENLGTALAEAFQSQGVEVGVCPNMRAVAMAPVTPTDLLDLTGDGLMKIGALAGLASGYYARRLTQRWGRAVYEDLEAYAGIRYRGAHQNGLCVVGWERTGPLAFDPADDHPLDGPLWDRLTVALADQGRTALKIDVLDCPDCQRDGTTSRLPAS